MINGPVTVKTYSGAGGTIPTSSIASQRSIWGSSFEDELGYPAAALSSNYHWTWYDQASAGALDWVLIAALRAQQCVPGDFQLAQGMGADSEYNSPGCKLARLVLRASQGH